MVLKFLKVIGVLLLSLIIIGFGVWGALALFYQLPSSIKLAGAIAWAVLFSVCFSWFLYKRTRVKALVVMCISVVALLVWWTTIRPSLYRNWTFDTAHTFTGRIDNNIATLYHVRNFNWTDPETANPAVWEERIYDLDQLSGLDMFASYWSSDAIAHILVSFGFEDGEHVVFSIETRKTEGEEFSSIGGFFKEFELAFIAADENDIIRLRTNIRHEDVYLYPIKSEPENRVKLFKEYVKRANKLAEAPSFYNTITANCSTVIYSLIHHFRDDVPFNWHILISGYLPDYLAEQDDLNWPKPYGDIRKKAAISKKAIAITEGNDYSKIIRE